MVTRENFDTVTNFKESLNEITFSYYMYDIFLLAWILTNILIAFRNCPLEINYIKKM